MPFGFPSFLGNIPPPDQAPAAPSYDNEALAQMARDAINPLGARTRSAERGDSYFKLQPSQPPGFDPNKVTSVPPQANIPADEAAGEAQDKANLNVQQTEDEMAGVAPYDAPSLPTPYAGIPYGPVGGRSFVENIYANTEAAKEATRKLGRLNAQEATDSEAIARDSRERLEAKFAQHGAERAAERAQIEERIRGLNQEADQIAKTKLDEGRIFRSPAGILGGIGAVFIQMGSNDPTTGVSIINQMINRDLDVQKMELQSRSGQLSQKRGLLHDYMQLTGDEDQARLMAEAKMKEVAAMKLREVGAKYGAPKAMAIAEAAAVQMETQANQGVMHLHMSLWRDAQRMPPDVKKAYEVAVGGPFFEKPVTGPPAQGQQAQRQQAQGPQTVSVPPPPADTGAGPGGYGVARAAAAYAEQNPPVSKDEITKVATLASAADNLSKKPVVVAGQKLSSAQINTVNKAVAAYEYAAYLRRNPGNPAKARTEYLAALSDAKTNEKNGLPAINKAIGEDTMAAAHAFSLARSQMATTRRNLGNKFDEFMTKSGLWMPSSWDVKKDEIASHLGLTSEQKQSAKDLHRTLMMAKSKFVLSESGKALTPSELPNIAQIVTNAQSAADWEDFIDKGGALVQSKINNGLGQGNILAQRYWLAARGGGDIATPLPRKEIRGK